MAPNIPDTYLWLGLGALTTLLITHVSTSLYSIKHLTKIHHPPPPPPGAPTPQENAIKTASLLSLATSHNTDIRHAATKLLCERFAAHPAAGRKLVRDLGSRDGEKRRRARLAVGLLRGYGVLGSEAGYAGGGYGYGYGAGAGEGFVGAEDGAYRGGGMSWEEAVAVREPREPLREITGEEEREARRRRREAVVIHEGEGSVGHADVWMRDREGVLGMDFEGEGEDVQIEVGELVIDGVVH